MLPDFPKAKETLKFQFDIWMQQNIKANSAILSRINRRFVCEGDKLGVLYENGESKVEPLNKISFQESIPHEEMQKLSADDVQKIFSNMSGDVTNQIEKNIIETLYKSAIDSNNEISCQELTADIELELMKGVRIYFHNDDRNKPDEQSFFGPHEALKKLKELKEKQTPEEKAEFERKREKILDEKYKEHMGDVRSRKIID